LNLYLDSSALIKRYIHEAGSERVLNLCSQADGIVLSVLCVPETVSTFCRLKRERQMNEDVYHLLKRDFQEDLQQVSLVDLSSDVLESSVHCLEKSSVGTLDAIHLATALRAGCDLFLSADFRQQKAAKIMGLKVEAV
jgi:uncharacterized protein